MSNFISAKDVFDIASSLVAEGRGPTQELVRQRLGRGSRSTIHKYLKAWKENCYQKSFMVNTIDEAQDLQNLFQEKYNLEQAIKKQLAQNEHLSVHLMRAELENEKNKERVQMLEAELRDLKEQYLKMEGDYKAVQGRLDGAKDDNEVAIREIIADKNKLIDALREEIKELNEVYLKSTREISYQGHDQLMQEKVMNINLAEKIKSLEKSLKEAESAIAHEKKVNEPLRQELANRDKMIKAVITPEQLIAYEKSMHGWN